MARILTFILILFLANNVLAQKPKDTLIYNLPVVNDKLIYEGMGNVKAKDKATLDTIARRWMLNYFRADQSIDSKTLFIPRNNDSDTFLLNRGIIDFHVTPGLISIPFVAFIRFRVNCSDNQYKYKIDSILFRPKNNTLNAIGYQNDPEYLIKVYKRKHLGLSTALDVTRGQIREYLSKMNAMIRECIASLNKAMAN